MAGLAQRPQLASQSLQRNGVADAFGIRQLQERGILPLLEVVNGGQTSPGFQESQLLPQKPADWLRFPIDQRGRGCLGEWPWGGKMNGQMSDPILAADLQGCPLALAAQRDRVGIVAECKRCELGSGVGDGADRWLPSRLPVVTG